MSTEYRSSGSPTYGSSNLPNLNTSSNARLNLRMTRYISSGSLNSTLELYELEYKPKHSDSDTHYRIHKPQMLELNGVPQCAEPKYVGPGQHIHPHHYPTTASHATPTIMYPHTITHTLCHTWQPETQNCQGIQHQQGT